MLQFISDKGEFLIEKNHLSQIIDLTNDLPENMFNDRFKYFKGFEFDIIYSEDFFNDLKTFLNKIGDTWFGFYTILPSAENYFLKHFNKYSVAKINILNGYDDYLNFLHTDPGNSPADALMYNAETIAIYSVDNRWAILGSKDCEIIIIGFTNQKIQSIFMDVFKNTYITDVMTRGNDLYNMLHFKQAARKFYTDLGNNYKDRI